MSGWTQAVCDDCWDDRNPERTSHRLIAPETNVCCYCGQETCSGIYLRVDPKSVPYPQQVTA